MRMPSIITSLIRRAKINTQYKVALTHVWYGEIAVGVLLLIVILSFDWYAFRFFVTTTPEFPQEEIQKIITLDVPAVKKAAETMAERAALLKSPTFPSLIQNPF